MRKTKLAAWILAAVLCGGMLLAGCGNADEADEPVETQGTEEPEEEVIYEIYSEEKLAVAENVNSSIACLESIYVTDDMVLTDSEDGIDFYDDDYGTWFFDQDGNCVGFITDVTLYEEPITQEEIEERMHVYLGAAVDDYSSDYELGFVEYEEDINEYTEIYYYYLDGIKTQDLVACAMDSCGNVVTAQWLNQGAFDDFGRSKLTSDKIEEFEKKALADYEGQDPEVNDMILGIDGDGKYYLDIIVGYTTEDGYEEQDSDLFYLDE